MGKKGEGKKREKWRNMFSSIKTIKKVKRNTCNIVKRGIKRNVHDLTAMEEKSQQVK